MNGVCLRKRWGKYYMKCIVKFYFLYYIYWMNISFLKCLFLVSIWNNTLKEKCLKSCYNYPFHVISKLSWHRNKLKNVNQKYDPIWIITQNFSMYYWLAKLTKFISKQHLHHYPYMGCRLCTHRYKCMGTKTSSFTEEHVSRNLCIEAPYWSILSVKYLLCSQ